MEYYVDPVQIGRRLRELRGYMPRHVVAEKTGIKERTLASYEDGTRLPSHSNMVALANFYKTSPASIFFAKR